MTRGPRPSGVDGWLAASSVIALVVIAPVAALVVQASGGSPAIWRHLLAYVLPAALGDTLVLLLGVGVITAVVGAGTGWLVTAFDFPGRRLLDWALLLPLAVPTYIVAYAYLDVLHPIGPVQSALRSVLGFEGPRDLQLPDIRSMAGCITLLGFVLYPYVYLTTRAVFVMQAANLMEVARTLGLDRGAVFGRVALPLARPAIAIGLSLALFEALNDIGASEFLGVRTLTVSVYSTWITRSDLAGAAQLALAMLAVVLAIVVVERRARRHRRYADDARHPRPLVPHRLRGWRAGAAVVATVTPVVIGFGIPAVYLVSETFARVRVAGFPAAVVAQTINTVTVSVVATAIAVAAGTVVVYATRLRRGTLRAVLLRAASMGYAVPGTVLAIGILPVVTGLEGLVDDATRRVLGVSAGLFLLGSGAAIVYAYVARFLAIAAGGIEAGFGRVSPSLDEAARTLGEGPTGRLRRLHLPIVRPAMATAAMLVFVDCMKELPATLLLRPVGFETLSTHLYGEAVRGTYENAAIAALLIVVVGLVPVFVLARLGRATPSVAIAARGLESRGAVGQNLG
ncbi:MAG TPA: iron ABC transporter permease [Vicinamibacterales bacterium]|nr:iron ABC transporter permease [Vicinamibacterales bacterium]